MAKRLNQENIDRVVRDIESGHYTQLQIADRNGISATSVGRIKRHVCDIEPGKYVRANEEDVIKDIKADILSCEEIIEKHGINISTLWRMAKRNNVEFRCYKKNQRHQQIQRRIYQIPIPKYNAIVDDLEKETYSHGEVAQRHGVNIKTVWYISQEHNLAPGRGIRFRWRYDGMTDDLAYLIGAYITDGHVQFSNISGSAKAFILNACDQEFVYRVKDILESLGGNPSIYEYKRKRKNHRDQLRVQFSSKQFCQWLFDFCGGKDKTEIPHDIKNGTKDQKLNFIAGCIDGDGHIDRMGTVTIANIGAWIKQLPEVILSLGIQSSIRSNGFAFSGKEILVVNIHRGDFVRHGGFCEIKRKQDRLLYASRKNIAELY